MSWLRVPPGAPFGTAELPYGVFSTPGHAPRVGVAVGDQVVDLAGLARSAGLDAEVFERPSLNAFLALGPQAWAEARGVLQTLLIEEPGREVLEPHLVPADLVSLHLPVEVADYVDFYASEHHAGNVGRIFRPGAEPLTPNWKHLPIGYHGRAGTVVVSGTPVRRPSGQRRDPGAPGPTFGPSTRLDLEAELGFVVGVGSMPGSALPTSAFDDHVFGVVLLNDWSARDIQAWEYVPLGPFLGKSFATSVSAWVLPLAALEEARVEPPPQRPEPLDYLRPAGWGYAVDIEVSINGSRVSTCPFSAMYWSPAQLMAHLTVNGANLRTGDLFASGTVSGPHQDQLGSLLELTTDGTRPLLLPDGPRGYLVDGDEVLLRARAPGRTGSIRLGEVRGRITVS